MKKTAPEEFRSTTFPFPEMNKKDSGMMGVFIVPYNSEKFTVVVNDDRLDKKWEHVSVSLMHRCPTWDEMCYIKSLFFEDEETVVQFHPKKSKHKNMHPFCLHMWRDTTKEFELPPSVYVAP